MIDEDATAPIPVVRAAIRRLRAMIATLAGADIDLLIEGETGTGKELVARAVHDHSIHSDEPFIAVNCTALTDTLLESELFGHVRGAFTGAVSGKKGYFELAGKGTIFLDEIGDTSPDFSVQAPSCASGASVLSGRW